jgi:hypothetical protein
MGRFIEVAAGCFKQIRHMVNQLFENANVSPRGLESFGAQLFSHCIENCRPCSANGQQHYFRQYKSRRRWNPWFVASG